MIPVLKIVWITLVATAVSVNQALLEIKNLFAKVQILFLNFSISHLFSILNYVLSAFTFYFKNLNLSDIDECLMTVNNCEQICDNKPGTYNCQCYPGFILADNRKNCLKGTHGQNISGKGIFRL